jgi:uncharacterized protein (UPF0262 family)
VLGIGDESGRFGNVIWVARFRRPIREYFAICGQLLPSHPQATPSEIETIDMARRGIHNQAAELLLERWRGRLKPTFPPRAACSR